MDIAAVAIFATKEDTKAYGGNDLVFPKNPDDVEQPADDKGGFLYYLYKKTQKVKFCTFFIVNKV